MLTQGKVYILNSKTGWIKHWFPTFEFTWLGEEMRENLPKEMDFAHEKRNAERAMIDFENIRTSLYIREFYCWANIIRIY